MKTLPVRTLAIVFLITLISAAGAWQQTPSGNGHVIDAPANIRRFAPPDQTVADKSAFAVAVDPATVDLRSLFDHLGPDATEWYQHVQTLSDPFFEGRGPGTRGMEIAAEYVEFHMRRAGLEPAFPAATGEPDASGGAAWTSYRQPFGFTRPDTRVLISGANVAIGDQKLREGEEFAILGSAGSGAVSAPVTFVGYGINEGPDGYSSFDEKTDLTGRIALLLRYAPLNEEGRGRWENRRFSAIAAKLRDVTSRGAAGILLVNPPGAVDAPDGLEPLERTTRFGARLSIPAAQLSVDAADHLVRQADPDGRSLMELRQLADQGAIRTLNFKDAAVATIAATVDRPVTQTQNIGGALRGRGALKDQWIIVGAHYDHLGYGYTGVRDSNNRGKLHPGADDNASGVAALLIFAKNLRDEFGRADGPADLRSFLFIAFSAEEAGLMGSRHFVEHPTFALADVDLMFNMDMVGRLRSDTVSIGGTGTAGELMTLLEPHIASSGLTFSNSPGGSGPSDHASFFRMGVPVLFLFTGMHADYHTPTDVAHTVNPAGAAKVIKFGREVLFDAASQPAKLTFAPATTARAGEDRGYGPVRLGITPGMAETDEPGIVVEGVAQGVSADKAGIQVGDILLMWDNAELITTGDLMSLLQKHKPGDVVNLTVRRGQETLTVPVTLQEGRRRQE